MNQAVTNNFVSEFRKTDMTIIYIYFALLSLVLPVLGSAFIISSRTNMSAELAMSNEIRNN